MPTDSAPAFRRVLLVPFADTDLAGIVHFANFFRYMEDTEHAFYRSLGFSVHPRDWSDPETVAWPRVDARCEYLAPVRFEDRLQVDLRVEKVGRKSVRHGFTFTLEGEGDRVLARGALAAVSVRFDEGRMAAVAIPPGVRSRLNDCLPASGGDEG